MFAYQGGMLHAEGVSLARLAAELGTPAWVYSSAALTLRYREFAAAFEGLPATICYSLKANGNQAVIATLARLGAGADVVSEGELRRALAAGVAPRKIVFAGVGKTAAEMEAALAAGILQFNVESEPELRLLSALAAARRARAPIALRVNPDVDARTHAKITTGKAENKFGIDIAAAPRIAKLAASLPGLALEGIAVHIGSQLTATGPFRDAFARLRALAHELIAAGHQLKRLDLGGGLGVSYDRDTPPALEDYAAAVRATLSGLDLDLVVEPGRTLVAEAGVLLTRVLYMKAGIAKRFAVVDCGMNDLLRPSLYDGYHPIRPVAEPKSGARPVVVDVVGPVCETGDTLALGRALPPLADGDLLAVGFAGAYGAVMSSTYNTRPLAPEVLVNGERYAVVRPRQSAAALIGLDRLPPWLEAAPPGRARTAR
ncbi:MAG: diaminopimelate decarboxylase [Pseudomonadota bacterium]